MCEEAAVPDKPNYRHRRTFMPEPKPTEARQRYHLDAIVAIILLRDLSFKIMIARTSNQCAGEMHA
jgi:hypothetical protein